MKRILPFLLSLQLFSCSGASHPVVPPEPIPPVVPFQLRIVEERNDGRNIYLAGEIESQTLWDSRDLLLRLSSYGSGALLRESFFRLPQSNALGAQAGNIAAGEVADFALSIPAPQVTDYQLELLWGQDAGVHRLVQKDGSSAWIELTDIKLQSTDCAEQPCQPQVAIEGNFFNQSASPVDKVRLAVSLVREGEAPQVSPGGELTSAEEAVEVSGLAISPGQSRPFRISLAGENYRSFSAGVRPYVRVLEVQ